MMLVIGVRMSWPSEVSSRSWLRRASARAVSAASRAASAAASPVMSRPVQTNPPSSSGVSDDPPGAVVHPHLDVGSAARAAAGRRRCRRRRRSRAAGQRGQQRLPDAVAQRLGQVAVLRHHDAGVVQVALPVRAEPDRARPAPVAAAGRHDEQHADSARPPAERTPDTMIGAPGPGGAARCWSAAWRPPPRRWCAAARSRSSSSARRTSPASDSIRRWPQSIRRERHAGLARARAAATRPRRRPPG